MPAWGNRSTAAGCRASRAWSWTLRDRYRRTRELHPHPWALRKDDLAAQVRLVIERASVGQDQAVPIGVAQDALQRGPLGLMDDDDVALISAQSPRLHRISSSGPSYVPPAATLRTIAPAISASISRRGVSSSDIRELEG